MSFIPLIPFHYLPTPIGYMVENLPNQQNWIDLLFLLPFCTRVYVYRCMAVFFYKMNDVASGYKAKHTLYKSKMLHFLVTHIVFLQFMSNCHEHHFKFSRWKYVPITSFPIFVSMSWYHHPRYRWYDIHFYRQCKKCVSCAHTTTCFALQPCAHNMKRLIEKRSLPGNYINDLIQRNRRYLVHGAEITLSRKHISNELATN